MSSFFFNKIAGLKPVTFLKKRLGHRCFSVDFANFFQNTFFYRTPPMAASDKSHQ